MAEYWVIILVAVCAVIGALGQFEFKRGAENLSFDFGSLITNWHLILGLVLYMTATVLYVYALSHGQLSVLYPIIATSYIWTALLAVTFLGEKMSVVNWAGILFILLGVGLVVR